MEKPTRVASGLLELTTLNDAILELFALLDEEEISRESYEQCLRTIGMISIGTLYGDDGIDIINELSKRLK